MRKKQEKLKRQIQLEEAREILYKASGGDWTVEEYVEPAIDMLAGLDDEDSLLSMLEVISSEYSDPVVKQLTNKAFTRHKSQGKIDFLKRELASFSSDSRLLAADILYQLGETRWKGVIVGDDLDFDKLAETDYSFFIEILAGIAGYNGNEPSPLLKKVLETEIGRKYLENALYKDLLIGNESRHSAAEMLAKLGEPQWKEIIRGDDFDCRRIMETGHPKLARILPEIIRNHNNLETNPQLIAGLRYYSKEPQIITVLMELLKHENYRVREIAAGNLVSIAKTDFSITKRDWKKASKLIKAPRKHRRIKPYNHADAVSSSDCKGHYDNSEHQDTGIGLEIPPEIKCKP